MARKSLEEVTELGVVTRRPGETRARLARGEADLVLGRDAGMVVGLKRKTGARISIKGGFEDKERAMVITGEREQVAG